MKTTVSPSPSLFSVLKAIFLIAFWPILAVIHMVHSKTFSKEMYLFLLFGVIGWTSLGVIVMTYQDIEKLDWNIFQLSIACINYIFFCWRTLLLITDIRSGKNV